MMLTCFTFAFACLIPLAVNSVTAKPIVVRNSPITIPIVRRMNFTGGASLREIDQARAKSLRSRAKSNSGSPLAVPFFDVPATNGVVDYTASVGVGSPPTTFQLLIDTGSSNTWVGAQGGFVETSTTQDTGNLVSVTYGSGFFIGEEIIDDVTLAPGVTISGQSLGVAEFSEGFDGVDGILGIGPQDLTCGTLFPDETACIPTVTDNAFSAGLIPADEVGISFAPSSELSSTNGQLTFGGAETSDFTGPLNFVPITTTSPSNEFVGIDQSITYGAAGTPILSTTAGVADTGTTLLLLATDALSAYEAATGAVPDDATGLLKITSAQFANLESLFFNMGDFTLEFTPNAQIFPRALNTAIGGTADGIYLIVGDLGTPSGEGLDFINGMVFLERFFMLFDIANSRVGFATTQFTDATTN